MVEAPGTAPGSDTLIPRGVYRHSRFPDRPNIGIPGRFLKTRTACRPEPKRGARGAKQTRSADPELRARGGSHRVDGRRMEYHSPVQSNLAAACALPRRAVPDVPGWGVLDHAVAVVASQQGALRRRH